MPNLLNSPARRAWYKLLRPKHWIKNLFVLAPLVFAAQFTQLSQIVHSLIAYVGFCLAASSVYIINDIYDLHSDRLCTQKSRHRPLANGDISIRAALLTCCLLLSLLTIGSLLLPQCFAIIGGYVLLNIAYSYRLKHIAIIDLFCIASGFVLRVWAGAVALQVPLSTWMFITTLCLALFLATIKRQKEFERNHRHNVATLHSRKVLNVYTLPLLKRYAEISAISTLMFYCFFVLTTNPQLTLSIPIVIFGIFRYWLVVETTELGESPTDVVWRDRPLISALLVWLVVICLALWPI